MKAIACIAAFVISVALAVTFVAVGFAACILPPVTTALASSFATDNVSPYNREQLTRVAEASRDFSFGAHDERALYQTVYEVAREYERGIEDEGGGTPQGFPALGLVRDVSDVDQLRSAFAGASELYCLSPDAVRHLDDCNALVRSFLPMIIACAVVAVGGLAYAGVTSRWRLLGSIALAAGVVVLAAFACLGVWAAVDFDGFFTTFHQLFFRQGNWQFPYDSLLICSLPTEFWMGMGAVWLAVTGVLSVAAIVVGWRLRRV